MRIERRICNICRIEFALDKETYSFLNFNRIDEYTDLCNKCLEKIKKYIEIDNKLIGE